MPLSPHPLTPLHVERGGEILQIINIQFVMHKLNLNKAEKAHIPLHMERDRG